MRQDSHSFRAESVTTGRSSMAYARASIGNYVLQNVQLRPQPQGE